MKREECRVEGQEREKKNRGEQRERRTSDIKIGIAIGGSILLSRASTEE